MGAVPRRRKLSANDWWAHGEARYGERKAIEADAKLLMSRSSFLSRTYRGARLD